MRNLGYFFYKEYFNPLSFRIGHDNVKIRFKPAFDDFLDQEFLENIQTELPNHSHAFRLESIYPGLLTGSGYNHEVGKQEGEQSEEDQEAELKLGFFFDHTTGLPLIPGSGVKGSLRSAFGKDNGGYIRFILKELADKKRKTDEKTDKELISEQADENINTDVELLVKEIFDCKDNHGYIPVYKRDVFFDAWPVFTNNDKKTFLGTDNITPHKHPSDPALHPFASPVPLKFLKLLPQLVFQFSFRLGVYGLPTELKSELFRQIFLDLGIGAKTNTGYGQLKEASEKVGNNGNGGEKPVDEIKDPLLYKKDDVIEVVVVEEKEDYIIMNCGTDLLVKKKDSITRKWEKMNKSFDEDDLKPGARLKIRINHNFTFTVTNFTVLPPEK